MSEDLKWTDERAEELMILRRVLNIAASLNHGNNICERIKTLEQLTSDLTGLNFETRQPSFISFLESLCIADRTNKP